jgi:hypothetical protein
MASIHPIKPNAEVTPLNQRAEANLRFIRDTMERASSFTAVPGWGLVGMGVTALAAAMISTQFALPQDRLFVWLVDATIAIPLAVWSMSRKASHQGTSMWTGSGRKFLMSFLPPVTAGAALTAVLVRGGMWEALVGTWLLMYGAGVTTAGSFSVKSVPVMGLIFMALGLASFLTPAAWGTAWMALGFGLVHLVFGVLIAKKHGG